jgi:AraC-like DNA-binding protein
MLSDTRVFATRSVTVHDVVCETRAGPGLPEPVEYFHLILPRRGVFVRRSEGRRVLADAHTALACFPEEIQVVDHPTGDGDRSTVLVIDDAWRDAAPLSAGAHAVGTAVWHYHRTLVESTALESTLPLALEEATLAILDVIANSAEGGDAIGRRTSTQRRHRRLVADCRALLASSPSRSWTLDTLGEAVGSSPFHLARVFRSETGTSIHRYLTRLRISEVADRLWNGANDITSLAVEWGFADHAHLTRTFRQVIGTTPSEYRSTQFPSPRIISSDRRAVE